MQINLSDINKLKAALICAGNKDLWTQLNGVRIEANSKQVLLVSTDGRRLSVIRDQAQKCEVSFTIPRHMIEAACKLIKGRVYIDYNPDTLAIKIGDITVKAIDIQFPEWRRMIPDMTAPMSNDRFEFDSKYIGDFGKIAKFLNCENGAILMSSSDNKRFMVKNHNEDFFGIVMAYDTKLDLEVPSWIK